MLSVLIPTRRRLDRLETLLRSFEDTRSASSELVFRVDRDDEDTIDFLTLHRQRFLVGPRGNGYADMPHFFNELAQFAHGDVLMCGNDDMVFRSHDWDRRLLDVANQYPDGVFDLGVTTHNETHFPFSTVSRRVVDALGYIWDPTIFWGDIYLRDVMSWFGRAVMVASVRIDHDWAGHNPDQTFRETRAAKATVEGSQRYWEDTHASAVRRAVAKLEGMYVAAA